MRTCNYAVVRFLPYRETGEFVNVGVVLHCREANFFDVALETQRRQRIKACQKICDELRRQGVRVLTVDDENGVLEFAKIEGN